LRVKEMNELWTLLGKLYSDKPLEGKDRKDLVEEAKRRVFAYVWNRMRKHGEIRPPFIENPEKSSFVKAQRVQEIIPSDIRGEAYLLRKDNGFVIIIRKDLVETRSRTVIAHELGHTFFFDADCEPIHPYVGSTVNRPNDGDKLWSNIEGPAFEIGRQILVPEQLLPKYKVTSDISIKAFNKLRRKFNVSTDIMARRLIHDLNAWDDVCIFVTTYEGAGIKLPKNSERFVGPSFKKRRFSLNKNWDTIVNILNDSINNADGVLSKRLKIERHAYHIESYCKERSPTILCMIKPA